MRRLTVFVALALALPAEAQGPLDLIGHGPKPYIEPEGFYRVVLPSGFDCEEKGRRHLECKGNRGANALLTLQVLDVPPSATPELVALNEMERLKKKPHFEEIQRTRTTIDGDRAVTVAFRYDYMGNVEYAAGVQALYLVRKNKLFVIHFESRLDQFGRYAKDLAALYGSFKPAKLDEGGNPILDSVRPPAPENDLESLERQWRGRY